MSTSARTPGPTLGTASAASCRSSDQVLGAGRSVAVDNTNPAPEDRLPLVAAPPSAKERFDRVHTVRMTAARTFVLGESATSAEPWPAGGHRQLDR